MICYILLNFGVLKSREVFAPIAFAIGIFPFLGITELMPCYNTLTKLYLP